MNDYVGMPLAACGEVGMYRELALAEGSPAARQACTLPSVHKGEAQGPPVHATLMQGGHHRMAHLWHMGADPSCCRALAVWILPSLNHACTRSSTPTCCEQEVAGFVASVLGMLFQKEAHRAIAILAKQPSRGKIGSGISLHYNMFA